MRVAYDDVLSLEIEGCCGIGGVLLHRDARDGVADFDLRGGEIERHGEKCDGDSCGFQRVYIRVLR